jgi:hypothetical protein
MIPNKLINNQNNIEEYEELAKFISIEGLKINNINLNQLSE